MKFILCSLSTLVFVTIIVSVNGSKCRNNDECGDFMYCSTKVCGGVGYCMMYPPSCPFGGTDYVCGCNGNTYNSRCWANSAGVNVDYQGKCQSNSTVDCTSNDDCTDKKTFCQKDACDSKYGKCAERPEYCAEIFDPVCGCNGKNYDNPCFANGAGANVKYHGECIPQCQTGKDCDMGYICFKEPGECEGPGVCRPMPEFCHQGPRQQVCGCDGKTYPNACYAIASSGGVKAGGACANSSCTSHDDCKDTEFCQTAVGECDMTKTPGECTRVPQGCSFQIDPVCTCEGETETNACYANSVKSNIKHMGPCESEKI